MVQGQAATQVLGQGEHLSATAEQTVLALRSPSGKATRSSVYRPLRSTSVAIPDAHPPPMTKSPHQCPGSPATGTTSRKCCFTTIARSTVLRQFSRHCLRPVPQARTALCDLRVNFDDHACQGTTAYVDQVTLDEPDLDPTEAGADPMLAVHALCSTLLDDA